VGGKESEKNFSMQDWQYVSLTAPILGKYLDITSWILCKSHVSCFYMHSGKKKKEKKSFQITILSVMSVCMQITVSIAPERFWSNFVWDPREIIPAWLMINYVQNNLLLEDWCLSKLYHFLPTSQKIVHVHYKDQLANAV